MHGRPLDFDFDEWRRLAESSPQAFEQSRLEAVEGLIAREGCNAVRLRGLQCRIDLERRRARTPLKSCLRISGMMWESFSDFQETLNEFLLVNNLRQSEHATTAKIIPFPAKIRHD